MNCCKGYLELFKNRIVRSLLYSANSHFSLCNWELSWRLVEKLCSLRTFDKKLYRNSWRSPCIIYKPWIQAFIKSNETSPPTPETNRADVPFLKERKMYKIIFLESAEIASLTGIKLELGVALRNFSSFTVQFSIKQYLYLFFGVTPLNLKNIDLSNIYYSKEYII